LLEAGIDPNLPDEGVGPPLHLAAFYRRVEAVDLLRSYGAVAVVAKPIRKLIAVADPNEGEVIAGTCKICHHLEAAPPQRPLMGPPLWDIVGRPKASIAGFAYSDALKAAGGTWNYDDLNSFLADPRGNLPGTKMTGVFGIRTPERRASLIRYLRDHSAAPAPLLEQ
jgi:cytochrome c